MLTHKELCRGDGIYDHFSTPHKTLPKDPGNQLARLTLSQESRKKKHPWHNQVFEQHRDEIKTFADVGCALPIGAPMTVEARDYLPSSKIQAVDVIDSMTGVEDPVLKEKKIEPMLLSIVKSPLPKEVDAIRFSNVAYHLSESDRRRAVRNIHKSLREGGLLMNERCLYRKKGESFELIGIGGI